MNLTEMIISPRARSTLLGDDIVRPARITQYTKVQNSGIKSPEDNRKHRTASVNEYSTRYSEAIDSCQTTDEDKWRLQSSTNKQGSTGFLDKIKGAVLSRMEKIFQAFSREVYHTRLRLGVAREQARKDLPLSTYTEAYWKIDLHNLFHFLSLRMDPHAQWEIRQYANQIAEIVKIWVPMAWEAFETYRLGAMFLSSTEVALLTQMHFVPATAQDVSRTIDLAKEKGWLERGPKGRLYKHRERQEFEAKLHRLGIPEPWLQVLPNESREASA